MKERLLCKSFCMTQDTRVINCIPHLNYAFKIKLLCEFGIECQGRRSDCNLQHSRRITLRRFFKLWSWFRDKFRKISWVLDWRSYSPTLDHWNHRFWWCWQEKPHFPVFANKDAEALFFQSLSPLYHPFPLFFLLILLGIFVQTRCSERKIPWVETRVSLETPYSSITPIKSNSVWTLTT